MDDFNFKTRPYAHQLEAFERFKDSEYFALFADMGTGKTKVVIDVGAYRYLRGDIEAMLIIAPNNVHTQWVREQFPLHCPVPYRPFVWKSGKSGNRTWARMLQDFLIEDVHALKVLAVNVEALQSDSVIPTIAELVKNNKTFIVIDEATRIKNFRARRSKVAHKLNKYGQRCILTGTPTAKSPFDLWSMFEFLRGNYFECNFFVFQHRYGVLMRGANFATGGRYTALIDERGWNVVKVRLNKVRESRGGELMPDDYESIGATLGVSEKNVRFIDSQDVFVRYKRLDELKAKIAPHVFSVRKEDCLDLPPKVYEKIEVDMGEEQARVYRNLKTELLAEYEGKEVSVANKVALSTRLMQVAGGFFPYYKDGVEVVGGERRPTKVAASAMIGEMNVKLEALLEDLEEVSDDQQFIVWAHFVPELQLLHGELSKRFTCCLYYGGTAQDERDRIKVAFQHGEYRCFVGNAQTAGFGLNLQCATLQYFFSNTFRTEDRLQAEDRSHRSGVRGTVVIKDIFTRKTLDDKIYANISTGKDLNDFFKTTSLKDLLNEEEDTDGTEY